MNARSDLSSLPRLFRAPGMEYKLSISVVEPLDILHLKIVEDLITTKSSIVTNKSNSGRQEVGHRFFDLPVGPCALLRHHYPALACR